jgi:hypothetical protein
MILHSLHLPPSVPIRVLAPYLDTNNPQLRSFVRDWFQGHDNAGPGVSPLRPVNYEDYRDFVLRQVNRNEEVPAPFVEYIYERHPGKALLVFAYASRRATVVPKLQELRKKLEDTPQQREKTDAEILPQREKKRQNEMLRQREKEQLSEILLAEHIVSNAIWLKENDFAEQYSKAMPEATAELVKLAKHKQWWVRLYVAEMMRRHAGLREPSVLKQLASDNNQLVAKAANKNPFPPKPFNIPKRADPYETLQKIIDAPKAAPAE